MVIVTITLDMIGGLCGSDPDGYALFLASEYYNRKYLQKGGLFLKNLLNKIIVAKY